MSIDHTDEFDTATHQPSVADRLRTEYLIAALPVIQEMMGLLTDSIKDLREELKLKRESRAECAPLERELRLKRLTADLEDFDAKRSRINSGDLPRPGMPESRYTQKTVNGVTRFSK